jgi:prolipoprotein diacylglyceryltransferase
VLLALAFVAAVWWVARAARREGLDPDRLTSLGFWAIAGGLIGSKLLLVLRTLPDFITQPSQLWSLSFLEGAGNRRETLPPKRAPESGSG